tara:strand:- start:8506 stop:9600 length:1095 start_codon:yes stop_codon:yes gene_type:complete
MRIGLDGERGPVVALAEKLEEQRNNIADYKGNTESMSAVLNYTEGEAKPDGIALALEGVGAFPTNRICDQQIAARLKIPKPYWDRCRDNSPELLTTNINHWLKEEPEDRLFRTLAGTGRAFLSNRYRSLDNYDLAEAVLPPMIEAGCEVKSCEITDSRMYIKAITYERTAEIKQGDTVAAGIMVSNSEVGQGALFAGAFTERLICTNGMVHSDWGQRKYHVGAKQSSSGMDLNNAWELFSDNTKSLSDRAFWAQVSDTVRGVLSQDGFDRIVEDMREAADQPINTDPIEVVERTQKKFKLNDTEKGGILQHLLQGGEMSKWGLANAVTRTAEDAKEYDRATEMEALGWNIVKLPQRDWSSLTQS